MQIACGCTLSHRAELIAPTRVADASEIGTDAVIVTVKRALCSVASLPLVSLMALALVVDTFTTLHTTANFAMRTDTFGN